MRDAGCEMQDAGCKMQDARCKMQDARCEMRDARCEMRDAGKMREATTTTAISINAVLFQSNFQALTIIE
jgi:hypothetical protein